MITKFPKDPLGWKRHNNLGHGINFGLLYDLQKHGRGLLTTRESRPSNQDHAKEYKTLISSLAAAGIFRKANSVVQAIVPPIDYHSACNLIDQAVKEIKATDMKAFQRRPYSGLTIVVNIGTVRHTDSKDHGQIPALCTRFGDISEPDRFIIPKYGI